MLGILSSLLQDIAIISPNGSRLIAITIYRGLDLLRARSKCRSISTRLSWRTAALCFAKQASRIGVPLAAGIPTTVEIRRFPPRICLNVSPLLLACVNGPRARKVLLLPGGYHRQAVDIKDPFYISAVAG